MDFTVHPNTRIARLPAILRPPALLARNLIRRERYWYPYRSDEIATAHRTPFLHDRAFKEAHRRVMGHWGVLDIRWRLWMLCSLARERAGYPAGSPANFAEFGVYRGGCSYMVLSLAAPAPEQRYFLFDTFEGVPADPLTPNEVKAEIAGDFGDTDAGQVLELLGPWRDQIELVEGDVFETLETTETGPLCFVHMDMNAAAPTVRALEYVYPRLVAGALIVFDDYGQARYEEQRLQVDDFFAGLPEQVVALPTGTGLLIKR